MRIYARAYSYARRAARTPRKFTLSGGGNLILFFTLSGASARNKTASEWKGKWKQPLARPAVGDPSSGCVTWAAAPPLRADGRFRSSFYQSEKSQSVSQSVVHLRSITRIGFETLANCSYVQCSSVARVKILICGVIFISWHQSRATNAFLYTPSCPASLSDLNYARCTFALTRWKCQGANQYFIESGSHIFVKAKVF